MTALRRVEDFLDVDFETDEVSTFGGLITFLLGRFPEKGERLYIAKLNMRIIIDSVEDKMVGDCTVILEDNNNKE
jgi:Mg2+/Co2+ transporter CorC